MAVQLIAPAGARLAEKDAAGEPDVTRTAHPRSRGSRLDPRLYQIAALSGLLAFGLLRLGFDIRPAQVGVILGVALLSQLIFSRLCRLPAFEPRSALISALSLCLLLRTSSPIIATLGAFVAIASKFLIRRGGKHIFNPTNLALVLMLATGRAWVSPAQWGNATFFAFLIACAGGLVVNRAERADVTGAFLVCYFALLFSRAGWLGQRWTLPVHQLESGAVLLFAFFMISDPRTTPASRAGRVLFAALAAAGAACVQFLLYRTNGLLWSLAALSPVVPLIDRWLPGPRYEWGISKPAPGTVAKEDGDETTANGNGAAPALGVLLPIGSSVLRLLRRER